MTKAEKLKAARRTRDEVEGLLLQACETQVRLDAAAAEMNAELVAVRARYESALAAADDRLKEIRAELQAWADANQAAFGERKSLAMVHGVLRYQTGQPTVKPVTGSTWEKVVALLKARLPQYVRTREEADREALVADRKALGDAQLRAVGLTVAQAERFHVDLNLESVPGEAVAR